MDFLSRVTPDLPRKFFDRLQRQLLGGNVLQHLLDLLHLVLGDQRFAELLQVDGRAIILGNRPNFVTRQHVIQDIVLLQPVNELR